MDGPETSKPPRHTTGAGASDNGGISRLLVEYSTDLISRHAPDGTFLYASPVSRSLLGYAPEDLLGRSIHDLAHPEDADELKRCFSELLEDAGPRTATYRVRREDGSHAWLETTCRAPTDGGQGAREVVCVSRDVTERKLAEEDLAAKARRQAAVAELGQRALAEKDLTALMDEAVVLVADTLRAEYCKVLELLPEGDALILRSGVGWREGLVGSATVRTTDSQAGYTIRSNEPVVVEDVRSDPRFGGSPLVRGHSVSGGVSVIIHGGERPFGVLGAHTKDRRSFTGDDINFLQSVANVLAAAIERNRTEEALRASEREYHALFEVANDAIIIYDTESRAILDVNESACRMYGIRRDAFVGMMMRELSRDHARARRYLKTLLEEGSYRNFETLHRRADGALINVVANSSVIEFRGRRAVLSIYRDITDSKMMEARLREAEARYRTLVEQIPAVIYVQQTDERGTKSTTRTVSRTTYISPRIEQMQGYTPEECIEDPEHWRKTLHPDDRERVLAEDARTNATGEPFRMEYRQICKDGRTVWVRDEAILVRDERDEPLYWQGVLLDITDRKRAEEALASSESRFRATFDQAAVGMAHIAPDGRWLMVNQKLCDIVGYPREELLDLTFQYITHPDDLDADLEYARRLLAGEIDTYTMEKRYLRKDGPAVWVKLTGSLVRDSSGEPDYFIAVIEDITRQKRLEESLREIRISERRRIARDLHDVVLQDLAGALQGMQATRIEGTDLDLEIDALRRAVGGLRGAIYDLRLAGRRPFVRAVESLVELNRQMAPERKIILTIPEDFPPELPEHVGTEILRILQEALVNVRRHSNARRVEISLGMNEGAVRAEVSDDGGGFDPPSTRPGVGISGMRERALALGGTLKIRSAPGDGASVSVEVPI